MEIKIRYELEDDQVRLDVFAAQNGGISRSFAQKLIEEGKVLIDGVPGRKNDVLSVGQEITVLIPDPRSSEAEPEDIPLDIVYEDDSLIVINKPRGMVVHPAPGNPSGTLVNALLFHCGKSLSGVGGVIRPGIVHRIDKDTSGLLVAAKTDNAHLCLSEQLKDKTLSRVYDAVIYGRLKDQAGRIEAPVGRSLKDRKKMAVVDSGRYAATRYEVLAEYNGFSHVRCELETGRTHQIRVHMAYLGHPLAGDPVYGPKDDKTGLMGQCLNASRISFLHPETMERMSFEVPLPDYFIEFIKRIS